jgi:hypothetical protein
MKKVLLAAGAFSALAIALPAAAQPYRGGDAVHQRFRNLEQRIERGVDRGLLNRREAIRLRAEFRQLVNLDARYRYDGLSRWEHQDLMRRVDNLSARVRYERRDDDRRGDGRYDGRYDDRRSGYGDDDRRWRDRS